MCPHVGTITIFNGCIGSIGFVGADGVIRAGNNYR